MFLFLLPLFIIFCFPDTHECTLMTFFKFIWAPYDGLEASTPTEAFKDQHLWTSCTMLIYFAVAEWH